MKLAFIKDSLREIKRSLSRFLSVFAIVALGVAFFAGVKATCPDMKLTADKYFDDYRLMDVRVVSTMGITHEDVEEIKKIPGLRGVYPSCNIDSLVQTGSKDLVVRVLSLPVEKLSRPDESFINRPKLIKGRWPENENECVTEQGKILDSGMTIGSKLTLASGTDEEIGESLKNNEFTITGLVETPYYIAFDRGISKIGSGKINTFIMIPEQNFKLSVYTDVFLTVRGALPLPCYTDAYKDTVEPVVTALEDISGAREEARRNGIVTEANDKLSESKQELSDAEATQKRELKDAMQKINDAQEDIDEGEKEIAGNETRLNNEIKKAKAKLNKGYADLKAAEKEYAAQSKAFLEAKKKAEAAFPAAQAQIDAARAQIAVQEETLNRLKYALANDPTLTEDQKAALLAQITAGEEALSQARAEVSAAQYALDAQKKQLSDTDAQLKQARKTLDSSKTGLNKNKRLIASRQRSARKKIEDAKQELNDAKQELADGRQEYDDKKNETDAEIADAHKKISDAEKDISEIEQPEWYVLDRDTNPGFAEYEKAADRMDAIALVFPVFFILVTALVCLTTMTRMIDEQRTYIGTLKALGYSKASIAAKYLFYASFASISGSVTGAVLGFQIFPSVISNAYAIMYTLPPVITAFHVPYALMSILFAVLTTSLTAWAACYKELKAVPAVLMRAKAPRPGKRVLLEKIEFIWSRLNFTQKITMRNIFRYKKRFLMTVLGIAGCSALVLSGFGLKDSISSIATKQFDELFQYNMLVTLSEEGRQDLQGVKEMLDQDKRITGFLPVREQVVTVNPGADEKTADLYVPEDTKKLRDFIVLRERLSGKRVFLADDGVVLTEKLALKLQAGPGDTITISDEDDFDVKARVSGITENYVAHYIYMPPALYQKLFAKPPEFNEICAKTTDNTESFEDGLSTALIGKEGISAVNFSTYISRNFNDIISSLYYVVLVLIVSAGGLAMVVLYNLTNINITERLREIATIKVLGFYDNEVSAYVYRENILLTVIGLALGLVLGIFLHQFVVTTAEVDYVMFGREIAPLSYLFSTLLTACFTCIVNFTMYFRLRGINMVESLKSLD